MQRHLLFQNVYEISKNDHFIRPPLRKLDFSEKNRNWVFSIGNYSDISSFKIYMNFPKTSIFLGSPLRKLDFSKKHRNWVFSIGRCSGISFFKIYVNFPKTNIFNRLIAGNFDSTTVFFEEILRFFKVLQYCTGLKIIFCQGGPL